MRLGEMLIAGCALLVCTGLIFRKVGADYREFGILTKTAACLETLIFFLHGVSSYAFLDSRLSSLQPGHWTFVLALVLMGTGVAGVLLIMAQLGWEKTVGQRVDGLHSSGAYRYSRNPQLILYFLVVLGYILLWPSWTGLVWVGLYGFIAHNMVQVEEAHLSEQYGEAYEIYRRRTPRYIGFPDQNPG
ncbi:MAG: isoprenylcysteine carboxylmethyltransferase family protein [Anaerolineales bacterium]|nr:isoprenylcysteine carboxylmethyltransferase family protein [Anaerolineales bacterium]